MLNPRILDFKTALGGGNNYLYITYKIEAHMSKSDVLVS